MSMHGIPVPKPHTGVDSVPEGAILGIAVLGAAVVGAAVVGAAVLGTAVRGGAVGSSVGSSDGVLVGIAVVREAVGATVGPKVVGVLVAGAKVVGAVVGAIVGEAVGADVLGGAVGLKSNTPIRQALETLKAKSRCRCGSYAAPGPVPACSANRWCTVRYCARKDTRITGGAGESACVGGWGVGGGEASSSLYSFMIVRALACMPMNPQREWTWSSALMWTTRSVQLLARQ
jgi:hypothetical protein